MVSGEGVEVRLRHARLGEPHRLRQRGGDGADSHVAHQYRAASVSRTGHPLHSGRYSRVKLQSVLQSCFFTEITSRHCCFKQCTG